IADLERQLREARAAIPKPPPKKRATSEPSTTDRSNVIAWIAGGALLVVVAIAIGIMVWLHARDRERVANGWGVDAYLPSAVADARGMESDAELERMYGEYVDSAGMAQLQLGGGGRLIYVFRSPHLSVSPAQPQRLGAPQTAPTPNCLIREEIWKRDTDLSTN